MTFLGENKHVNSQTTLICVTRLNCLKARLKKDEKLLQEYDSIFKAQLEAGIIELVPNDEEDFEGAHFLPHYGVLREDRETTKLRIVFYGSERADKNQFSLNDCLEKGPEPQVSELLANSLYVDDFPGGASDDESAIHVYQRAKAIMKEGGFNLRKWKTN